MSNYYFNEKKGIYERIDEAPLAKQGRLKRDKHVVFKPGHSTYETKKESMPELEIPTRRVVTSTTAQTRTQTAKKQAQPKKRKGCLGSLIGIGWLLYFIFGKGEFGDGLRDFIETLFG